MCRFFCKRFEVSNFCRVSLVLPKLVLTSEIRTSFFSRQKRVRLLIIGFRIAGSLWESCYESGPNIRLVRTVSWHSFFPLSTGDIIECTEYVIRSIERSSNYPQGNSYGPRTSLSVCLGPLGDEKAHKTYCTETPDLQANVNRTATIWEKSYGPTKRNRICLNEFGNNGIGCISAGL